MQSENGRNSLDLFAGAGGLSEGLKQAGFRTIYANDHEKPAMETFKRNHLGAKVSTDGIEDVDADLLREELGLAKGELDCLAGGPPCQGFSTYGQRDEADMRLLNVDCLMRIASAAREKFWASAVATANLS